MANLETGEFDDLVTIASIAVQQTTDIPLSDPALYVPVSR